jgi:hypothetical protein
MTASLSNESPAGCHDICDTEEFIFIIHDYEIKINTGATHGSSCSTLIFFEDI